MLNRIVFPVALILGLCLAQAGTGAAPQAAPQTPATPQAPAPAGGAASSQPAAPADAAPQAQPTFRTGIDFVRVDAIVTEKGQPVTDLTEADFEVREDGKLVPIEQFRLIKVDGNPRPGDLPPRQIRNRDDEVLEANRDDVRVIVFFLDDYHVRLATGISVKKSLIDFIEQQVRPNDMLAVMYPLMPVTALSFTRNHASIISAINNFEGRKFRYTPRNQFEEQYSQQPTEVVERVRNQVVMGALRGLAARLGSVREGRKAVVYVSEGFTAMLPPQLRNQNAELGGVMPNGVGPMAGENNMREDTARVFATADLMSQMQDIFTAANRNNMAIYSLDPRGLAVGEFGIDENVGPNQDRVSLQNTQDTLRTLSEQTDGFAIVNRNDLAKGLQQLVRDSSFYYLLGYTSPAKTDGKFHEIKVAVKRRGVDVRSRRGFWAATNDDATRIATRAEAPGVPKAFETALAAIVTPAQSSQYVRTWVGSERGENGKTRVTLVWEPITGPAGARRDPVGRVSVLAANANGDLVFRGRVPDQALASSTVPSPGALASTPTASGAQRIVFDAPPGPLELRLSVEGAAGGVLDNEVRKITIPDLTAPQAAISTPRVYRARTARDLQAIVQNAASPPLAVREFSRTERVLIRFDAYGAGTETPTATAILLNRAGQKMSDVPVVAATAGGTHQIDLGLASVSPGEYVVEITVKSGSGEAKELVAMRVVS